MGSGEKPGRLALWRVRGRRPATALRLRPIARRFHGRLRRSSARRGADDRASGAARNCQRRAVRPQSRRCSRAGQSRRHEARRKDRPRRSGRDSKGRRRSSKSRRAIREAKVPARVSTNAGGFVCNHLYFGALRHLADCGSPARAVFVHLPATPQQAPPTANRRRLTTDDAARALRAAAAALIASHTTPDLHRERPQHDGLRIAPRGSDPMADP